MNHTYRPIDADQKGYITAADYQKYVFTVSERMITDEEAANFIKNFDVDGDGRISYDEFVKLTRWCIAFLSTFFFCKRVQIKRQGNMQCMV